MGGDITITTELLSVTEGAELSVSTFGQGSGGNVDVIASGTVRFDNSNVFSIIGETGRGNGGNINITSGSLLVTNGVQVASGTLGQGNAGDVNIIARELIRLDGSNIFSSVNPTGNGNGGNINITTGSLLLTNSSLIAAAQGEGNAGSIVVNARNDVVFDGAGNDEDIGAFSSVESTDVGDGGSITINSESLLLSNGAELRVRNVGSGDAGSVTVAADVIWLENEGEINADTFGGGGNIDLRSPLLALRNSSSITTNAQGTATGGNININAGSGFIVAPPNENNDIIANGVEGSGGQITLTAQGIYGFDFRTREDLQRLLSTTDPAQLDPRNLPTNDVTAFSQANPTIDTGSVTVQAPNLDPTRRLTELPTDLTDPSDMIASACSTDRGSSFAITGRGGLPESPYQPLVGQAVLGEEWEVGEVGERREVREEQEEEEVDLGVGAIAEAQGWIVDRSGTVVLVAQQSQTRSSSLETPSCASLSSSP